MTVRQYFSTCVVFLVSLTVPVFCQRPVDVPKAPPTPSADPSGPMPVAFFVTDKSGAPVTGLQQQDFALQIDKQTQPIVSFAPIDTPQDPVEDVILIDSVNTRFNNVALAREQIGKYLTQNGGKLIHPTSLVFFSDTDTIIMPRATTDGNALKAALDKMGTNLRDIGRSSGFYGYVEELNTSLAGMNRIADYEAGRPGRKMLLWISPGWRPLSGPEVELTTKDENNLFRMLVRTSTALRKAHITLTSIDPLGTADAVSFRTFYYQEFLKGVAKPSQMQIGDLLLEVLATGTGGRVMNSSNDVAKLITNAAADSDAFYRIKFMPPVATRPNEYHEVKVIVDKPGLIAHSMTGYYAQPPAAK